MKLSDEETMLVETVRAFIDRDVKPTVRDVEHANEYPEAWIEQMKRIGIFGLAVPEEYGGTPVSTPLLRAGHAGAGARLDEPGRRDGRAHRRGQAVDAVRHRRAEGALPARRWPPARLRATMALTEPGGGSDLQNMTTIARRDGDDLVINGAKTWISNARRSGLIALLCKTDPAADAEAPWHLDRARRARRRA